MIKNSILEELIATGMTEHFIHDRIYQKIALTPADLRLCQTREPVRLRHISLSAVPPWMIPAGVAASRFEHTMGVVHLAKIVGERDEFQEIANNLVLAAFAHDLGAPPFSHLSEYFMVKLMGKNHEEFGEEAIAGGEFAEEVKRQGGNIGRVLSFVNSREKPFSDIINGTIDIDNLDNTLRYSLSLGLLQNSP